MARLRLAAVLALVTLAMGGARAQTAAFSRLSAADGLPGGAVWALIQDRQGFLWAGTVDGLARYDGASVAVYRTDPDDSRSLGANHVWALWEDAHGGIWAGTNGGGLARFSPRTGRFRRFVHDPSDPHSLCGNEVLALAPSTGGGLWAGTTMGVCRLDLQTGHFAPLPAAARAVLGEASGIGVLEDRTGALWIAGGGYGVFRYRPQTGATERFRHDPQDAATPAAGWAQAVLETSDGSVWVGHREGITRYDPGTGRLSRLGGGPGGLPDPHIRALAEGPDGALWIGSYGGGLYRRDARTGALTVYRAAPGGLPSGNVVALALDRAGTLWAGTSDAGVAALPPAAGAFALVAAPPGRTPGVRGALDAGGTVWIATSDGLAPLSPDGETVGPPLSACEGGARALAQDARGALWVGRGGEGGVCRVGPGGERAFLWDRPDGFPGSTGTALALDARGRLWAGTDEGVAVYDADANAWRPVHLVPADAAVADPFVTVLVGTRDGAVWVGTDGAGLYRLPPRGPTAVRWLHQTGLPHSLSSDAIHALHEGRDGAVWVGTDAGLDRIGPGERAVRRVRDASGAYLGTVLAIAEDARGRLWLAGRTALLRYDPGSGGVTRFDARGGLPDVTFLRGRAASTADGRLLFGTAQGLLVVRPDALEGLHSADAALVLTALDVAGRAGPAPPLWATRGVRLGPGERTFALHYAALDLGGAGHVRYRYRLDGLDAAWTEAGERRVASYALVPPGRYTFRVQATDDAGRWGPQTALALTVPPRWWETLAFRLALGLAFVGLAVAAYRWRVGTLLEAERARRRLADDLHDSLGARTSAVALLLDHQARAAGLPDEARDLLSRAARTARGIVDDLREAVWLVEPAHDRLHGTAHRLETIAHEALATVAHAVTVQLSEPDGLLGLEPRRHALLAFREALANAIRHGAPPVEVRVEAGAGRLAFEVRDAGAGFDPGAADGADGGRGLRTMRERAHAVGAHLEVVPSAEGTAVRFVWDGPGARGKK